MIIEELILFTDKLEKARAFYANAMECTPIAISDSYFSVRMGISKLTFKKSGKDQKYHYCFLIPSNQLENAQEWLQKRLQVIEVEKGKYVQHFESWNAGSIYFNDGVGNVVEFIVRYDLHNQIESKFSLSSVICVNEIPLPTADIEALNTQLENELGTHFWKGNFDRFGTNGNQNGLFLMPNYKEKSTWFPTRVMIAPSPLKAVVSSGHTVYNLEFGMDNTDTLKIEKL